MIWCGGTRAKPDRMGLMKLRFNLNIDRVYGDIGSLSSIEYGFGPL
jgi:hypothetical protein